jgi:type I restriction enzyme S subunit
MVPIAEIADINYGKNLPATELRHAGFPVYGAAGVVGFYSTSMFAEPVTLVTSRGSGSGTVHQTYEPAFITNNSFTVIPRSEWLGRHYLRFSLLNADILSLVTGSAQPQLTITNFSYLKLLEPSKHVALAFHKLLDPQWNKAAANDRESRTLATLRDTLLPKLLSGELSMAGLERAVEAVL